MNKFELLDYKRIIDLIRSKSKNDNGSINIIGKSILGIIGSVGLLFFYMLGYSFLYGFYFGGNNYNISILEIGLNIVPINAKFVAIIGITVLFLNCIFVLPIKEIYYSSVIKNKVLGLLLTVVFSLIIVYMLKILIEGNLDFKLNDLYLLFIPIYLPLFIISQIYITQYMNRGMKNIIKIIITAILIFIVELILLIFINIIFKNKGLNNIAIICCFLLYIPLMSIILSFGEIIFKHHDNIKLIINNSDKEYPKIELSIRLALISGLIGIAGIILVSIPSLLVGIGNFYGEHYNELSKEEIIYLQNNNEMSFNGKLVGYKDGNYYFSKYPDRTLVIVKSTQVILKSYKNSNNQNKR